MQSLKSISQVKHTLFAAVMLAVMPSVGGYLRAEKLAVHAWAAPPWLSPGAPAWEAQPNHRIVATGDGLEVATCGINSDIVAIFRNGKIVFYDPIINGKISRAVIGHGVVAVTYGLHADMARLYGYFVDQGGRLLVSALLWPSADGSFGVSWNGLAFRFNLGQGHDIDRMVCLKGLQWFTSSQTGVNQPAACDVAVPQDGSLNPGDRSNGPRMILLPLK